MSYAYIYSVSLELSFRISLSLAIFSSSIYYIKVDSFSFALQVRIGYWWLIYKVFLFRRRCGIK